MFYSDTILDSKKVRYNTYSEYPVYAPWFSSRLRRYINYLLTYLLTDSVPDSSMQLKLKDLKGFLYEIQYTYCPNMLFVMSRCAVMKK